MAKYNDFDTNSWVYMAKLEDADLFTKYSAAFEWSLQTLTTVGYGDI